MIAAHPSAKRAPPEQLRIFLKTLSSYVQSFGSLEAREGSSLTFIKERFGYPEEDIKVCPSKSLDVSQHSVDSTQAWLETVTYPDECDSIPSSVIKHALRSVLHIAEKSKKIHPIFLCFGAVSLSRQAS